MFPQEGNKPSSNIGLDICTPWRIEPCHSPLPGPSSWSFSLSPVILLVDVNQFLSISCLLQGMLVVVHLLVELFFSRTDGGESPSDVVREVLDDVRGMV